MPSLAERDFEDSVEGNIMIFNQKCCSTLLRLHLSKLLLWLNMYLFTYYFRCNWCGHEACRGTRPLHRPVETENLCPRILRRKPVDHCICKFNQANLLLPPFFIVSTSQLSLHFHHFSDRVVISLPCRRADSRCSVPFYDHRCRPKRSSGYSFHERLDWSHCGQLCAQGSLWVLSKVIKD